MTHHLDRFWCAAEHQTSFFSYRQNAAVICRNGNDRRLAQYNAFAAHKYQHIYSAQINAYLFGEHPTSYRSVNMSSY